MRETNFKHTDIGPIPHDWKVKRLGEIGEPLMCKRVLKEQTFTTGDIPFYKIGTFGKEPDSFISKDLYDHLKSLYSYPKKGDVLISAAGTIGRLVIFDGKPSYFQDSNIIWIGHDNNLIDNQFLYHALKIVKWDTETSCTITRLYNSNLKNTFITLPPIAEQEAIGKALSDVDELIDSLRKLIDKKRNIKQGAMSCLLTGKLRLPGFSEPWKTNELDQIGNIIPNNSLSWDCLTSEGTVADIHYGQILTKFGAVVDVSKTSLPYVKSNYEPRFLKSNIAKDGDVIFADTAEDDTVGKAVELTNIEDAIVVSGLHTFWFRPIIRFAPKFLGYAMNGIGFHSQIPPISTGTKVSSISKPNLLKLELSYPADIKEQEAIARILTNMDDEIESLEKKLAKYEQMKQGMMTELLTGKIRLI